jgi:C-terminal processing protease CtpA/Prc
VDLELIRRGQRHDVTLELEAFRPARASLAARDGALVLRIPGFDESTTADVARLVAEASGQESAGLLIDLRGVGGGDSAAAYAVADLFADGALGALRSRDTTVAAYTGTTPDAWRDRPGQLVVAMDRGSQGPAEVLATVLRQRAQARLVGERSFGYAGRRKLVELSAGDRLLVTDGFFAGPDGDGIDEGLAPDLLVDERSRRFGEQELPLRELILERGLRLLREAPAPQPAAPAAPAG